MSGEPKTTDPMVAALLRERDSYQRLGKLDRVAQVDEQLSLRGYQLPEPDKKDAPSSSLDEIGADTAPKGRRTAPRKTT